MLAVEMVQFSDFSLFLEQSAAFPRGLVEPLPPIPDLEIEMPRVYQRPSPPPLLQANRSVRKLLHAARDAQRNGEPLEFGKIYGTLTGKFRSDLQWALSCWDYLLSTQGCRFLARSSQEKLYSRGDYRVFTRNDFEGLAYRTFRECLLNYLDGPVEIPFERFLRERLWPRISESYQDLEEPADRNQRKLTAYSYLRCVPYRFMNRYHHERVYRAVRRLPFRQKQAVHFYHLSFYREETAATQAKADSLEFRRNRWTALRAIAREDYLSFRLLRQIERY